MKKKSDVLTLQEYEAELQDHPKNRYRYFKAPHLLHQALKRIGARSQGANQFLRSDYDEVSGIDTTCEDIACEDYAADKPVKIP